MNVSSDQSIVFFRYLQTTIDSLCPPFPDDIAVKTRAKITQLISENPFNTDNNKNPFNADKDIDSRLKDALKYAKLLEGQNLSRPDMAKFRELLYFTLQSVHYNSCFDPNDSPNRPVLSLPKTIDEALKEAAQKANKRGIPPEQAKFYSVKSQTYETILHIAAQHGCIDVIRDLVLRQGVNINLNHERPLPTLFEITSNGLPVKTQVVHVKALLALKANAMLRNIHGVWWITYYGKGCFECTHPFLLQLMMESVRDMSKTKGHIYDSTTPAGIFHSHVLREFIANLPRKFDVYDHDSPKFKAIMNYAKITIFQGVAINHEARILRNFDDHQNSFANAFTLYKKAREKITERQRRIIQVLGASQVPATVISTVFGYILLKTEHEKRITISRLCYVQEGLEIPEGVEEQADYKEIAAEYPFSEAENKQQEKSPSQPQQNVAIQPKNIPTTTPVAIEIQKPTFIPSSLSIHSQRRWWERGLIGSICKCFYNCIALLFGWPKKN